MDWGEIVRVALEVGVGVYSLVQRKKRQRAEEAAKRTASDLRRVLDEAHRLGREQDLSAQARALRPPKTPRPER